MAKKKQKEKVDWRIVCTTAICITLLEGFAIHSGHNGTILKLVLIVLAGIAGWQVPTDIFKRK